MTTFLLLTLYYGYNKNLFQESFILLNINVFFFFLLNKNTFFIPWIFYYKHNLYLIYLVYIFKRRKNITLYTVPC